jgi:hypothetical protein
MGWQEDSTPALPTDRTIKSADTSSDDPGYFSVPGQLGPLAPLFGYQKPKLSPVTGQTIADVGRVAADQVPFLGNAFDVKGAQERLKGTTYEGAGEALGTAATGAGGEALGAGRYIAGKVAPLIGDASSGVANFLANRIGGAAEQGTIAAAGTAGHGGSASDVAKSALIGGGTGAVLGPGARDAPVGRSADELEQANDAAWKVAENTPADPQAVANALGWTKRGLTPGEQVIMKSGGNLNSAVNQAGRAALNAGSMTVDDVSKFQDALWNAARNEVGSVRSTAEQRLANKFSDAVGNALGPNKSVLDDANKATSVMKTDRDISGWLTDPKSAPAKIQGALAKDPDLYSPELTGILTGAAQAGQPSITRNIIQDLAARAFKGGLTSVAGGPIAGVVTAATAPTVKASIRAAPIRNRLLAAQHFNSTGEMIHPSAFAQPGMLSNTGDLLRQATMAAGARGSL